MSLSKTMYDDVTRDLDPRPPCYGDEVEDWPSEQEMAADTESG